MGHHGVWPIYVIILLTCLAKCSISLPQNDQAIDWDSYEFGDTLATYDESCPNGATGILPCNPGQLKIAECIGQDGDTSGMCEKCPQKSYQSGYNRCTACHQCSECGPNGQITQPCTDKTDTFCESITPLDHVPTTTPKPKSTQPSSPALAQHSIYTPGTTTDVSLAETKSTSALMNADTTQVPVLSTTQAEKEEPIATSKGIDCMALAISVSVLFAALLVVVPILLAIIWKQRAKIRKQKRELCSCTCKSNGNSILMKKRDSGLPSSRASLKENIPLDVLTSNGDARHEGDGDRRHEGDGDRGHEERAPLLVDERPNEGAEAGQNPIDRDAVQASGVPPVDGTTDIRFAEGSPDDAADVDAIGRSDLTSGSASDIATDDIDGGLSDGAHGSAADVAEDGVSIGAYNRGTGRGFKEITTGSLGDSTKLHTSVDGTGRKDDGKSASPRQVVTISDETPIGVSDGAAEHPLDQRTNSNVTPQEGATSAHGGGKDAGIDGAVVAALSSRGGLDFNIPDENSVGVSNGASGASPDNLTTLKVTSDVKDISASGDSHTVGADGGGVATHSGLDIKDIADKSTIVSNDGAKEVTGGYHATPDAAPDERATNASSDGNGCTDGTCTNESSNASVHPSGFAADHQLDGASVHPSSGVPGQPSGVASRHPSGDASGRPSGGASLRLTGGASLHLSGGASVHLTGGASSHPSGGASRHPSGNASGRPSGGASLHLSGGASVHISGGASVHLTGGASGHSSGGASGHPSGGAGGDDRRTNTTPEQVRPVIQADDVVTTQFLQHVAQEIPYVQIKKICRMSGLKERDIDDVEALMHKDEQGFQFLKRLLGDVGKDLTYRLLLQALNKSKNKHYADKLIREFHILL